MGLVSSRGIPGPYSVGSCFDTAAGSEEGTPIRLWIPFEQMKVEKNSLVFPTGYRT